MPPPATPHRPSNRGGNPTNTANNKPAPTTSKQKLDIGQPLGEHDTDSVRAKVRKWQQQGGGVVIANDSVHYEEEEENPRSTAKDRKPYHSSKLQSSSTPRKRLVSDEHWKLNRNAPQTPPPSKQAPPPNKRIAEYTTNESLSSPSQHRRERDARKEGLPRLPPVSRSRDRNKGGATPESMKREHRKSRSSWDLDAKFNERHGTMRPRSSSRPRTETNSLPGDGSEVSEQPRVKSLPPEGDGDGRASEGDFPELSKRRARGPAPDATMGSGPQNRTPPPPPPAPSAPKPPKGGIFTHMRDESRKIFGRPEQPPKTTKGTKIEAWLSGTPDPFVNNGEDVDMPAPLNMRHRERRSSRRECYERTESEPSTEGHPRRRSAHARRARHSVDSKLDEEKSTEDRTRTRDRARTRSPSRRKSPSRRRSPSGMRRSNDNRMSKSPASVSAKESEAPEEEREERTEASTEAGETQSGLESEVPGDNPSVLVGRTRAPPSTGLSRLPTIASVESKSQESTEKAPSEKDKSAPAPEAVDAEERDQFDPNSLPLVTNQLRRRLTTHDDLISVLSTNTRSRSLKSARSLRSNKSRGTTATVADLLRELSADEVKYMRELKTLVGGVIPVLLACVLSKSDSALAAGLFRPSTNPKDEMNFTKPIVDMGIAIERLKALHKWIPQEQADSLLHWATGAQKVYRDYLKAWRLGFKDVIVNLAPLDEAEAAKNRENDGENDSSDTKSLDEGMARDENGDVVDNEGEKVDVAYLLKRPLVRLKYLAKTFKGINMLQPSNKADEVAGSYQALVAEARRRAREERARLEDESAASIDPTRARDPGTLGALAEVVVDQTRRVRARDFFNLSLFHSSGQVIDCRAELLMRDNAPVNGAGGDLLICEIDHSDRWLLFPPIEYACVSARGGDTKGEIVVMIRSPLGQTKSWQEVMSLQIEEEEIAFEWIQLLGLHPPPPFISRSQSFIDRARQRQLQQKPQQQQEQQQEGKETSSANLLPPIQEVPPSPSHLDVPIGEKATSRVSRRSLTPKESSTDPGTVETSSAVESRDSLSTAITDYTATGALVPKPAASPQPSILHARDPRASTPADSPGLKRSKAKRISRIGESPSSSPKKDEHALVPRKGPDPSPTPAEEAKSQKEQPHSPKTPTNNGVDKPSPRISSVPSSTLPSIPKLREGSSYTHVSESLDGASDEDDISLDDSGLSESPSRRKSDARSNSESSQHDDGDEPPPPPPHSRSPSSTGQNAMNTPVLSPTAGLQRRRGSSPLKHEYEPSTASDSFSDGGDSDTSTVRHYDMDSASEYSVSDSSEDDDESEDELESSLPPVGSQQQEQQPGQGQGEKQQQQQQQSRPTEQRAVVPSDSSLSPSSSASQGGYRSVPSQPTKSSRMMASIFAWSDRGTWESLLKDECVIIISPGLVEAYEMSVAPPDNDNSSQYSKGKPMIALELTPLVPIRRGTAIDISIRSPPTDRSKVTWSNNIMFRSRNADECESLYALINTSRINNPTYIALQNARGPFADQPVPHERSNKSAGGMFGWPRRRKSYRASSSSPRSVADNSESSVGTMASAFSALKRFGNGSKMFNIARSSVTSRQDDGSSRSATSGIGRIAAAIKGVDGIGLSNAKIRLYARETQTKWRDMGAARLTVMPAPLPAPENDSSNPEPALALPNNANNNPQQSRPSTSASTSRRSMALEPQKRILIRGKTRNEVLLDVCLGESSFERVARTGIAVSVWEEGMTGGAMPERGGVTGGTYRIYMVQMKSEAEAAYTFGLVGKLKY